MSSFLKKHGRQPKLYIDLPSNGRFYPDNCLLDNTASNLPVFGMTANDEIMIKTPDALFAGQATVEIIKNCIPNIQDPWKMPTIDVDHCLIAIRMATYGPTMGLSTTCPHCDTQQDVELNLNVLIDQGASKVFQNKVEIQDLTFDLRPLNYQEQASLQKRLYETQRQLMSIPKEWDDEKKQQQTALLLKESSKLQVETVMQFVEKISNGTEEEVDAKQIEDFLITGDAIYFNKLRKMIEEIRKNWDSKLIDKVCDNEKCKKDYKFSVTLDYSNFFEPRS